MDTHGHPWTLHAGQPTDGTCLPTYELGFGTKRPSWTRLTSQLPNWAVSSDPWSLASGRLCQGGACGAAGPASAPGSALARPARRTPGHTRAAPRSRPLARRARRVQRAAAYLAPDCPARGCRVNGGPSGRRKRSAAPTIDPTTTHMDRAPARKGQHAGQPPTLLSALL
jgi:hypothetical protein